MLVEMELLTQEDIDRLEPTEFLFNKNDIMKACHTATVLRALLERIYKEASALNFQYLETVYRVSSYELR